MTTEPSSTADPTLATPEQLAVERHRRYVLEQLGIAPLVSLQDAPGAAPPRRLFAPTPPKAEMANTKGKLAAATNATGTDRVRSPQRKDSSAIAALRADLSQASDSKAGSIQGATSGGAAETSNLETSPPRTGRIDKAPELNFTLLIAATGRWLWVECLDTSLIRNDQLHLIQAMGRVLEGSGTPIRHVQFDWPLVDHPQLPKDLNAARQSVAGQLQRLAREASASGIVVMGEQTSGLISEAINLTRLMIPATVAMLETPALKREAWQVLRPHVGAH